MTTPQELAEELIGTCNSCVPDERLETQADVVAFDALAFECDQCGWWCSTDELNNDGPCNLCDECEPDDEDDE